MIKTVEIYKGREIETFCGQVWVKGTFGNSIRFNSVKAAKAYITRKENATKRMAENMK